MSQAIRAALFAPHVNSNFAFIVPNIMSPGFDAQPEALAVNLTLMEVSQEKTGGPYINFHLIFHGPDILLAQGNYLARHEKLGDNDFFIVPIGEIKNEQKAVTGYQYQSCYSVKPEK
ncbi:MAG: hypothetical protein PHQ60_09210 [Sideroxydans sp.]|nr:hypothetical protein [Sideroxydans sp.]